MTRLHCCLSQPAACSFSVGREDDFKFVGLCEARGNPVLRIGVTDGRLKNQNFASWSIANLPGAHEGTLAELFGKRSCFIEGPSYVTPKKSQARSITLLT